MGTLNWAKCIGQIKGKWEQNQTMETSNDVVNDYQLLKTLSSISSNYDVSDILSDKKNTILGESGANSYCSRLKGEQSH